MEVVEPPMNVFSSVDVVRDWIVELADLRERYHDNHEVLRRITGEELYANRLLELLPTLRTIRRRRRRNARERSVERAHAV